MRLDFRSVPRPLTKVYLDGNLIEFPVIVDDEEGLVLMHKREPSGELEFYPPDSRGLLFPVTYEVHGRVEIVVST